MRWALRDVAVSAVFAGDSRYAPKTATSTGYPQAKVSTSVSRQYTVPTKGADRPVPRSAADRTMN